MANTNKEEKRKDIISQLEELYGKRSIFGLSNKVWVSGQLEEPFEFSHKCGWESFFRSSVIVTRNSGTEDHVPVIISEDLLFGLDNEACEGGKWIEVGGQLRTHFKMGDDNKNHLEISLFTSYIHICNEKEELKEATNANQVYLEGYVSKSPIFRVTPLGRCITDLFIAVNRDVRGSDYLPCIAWGRKAAYASKLNVGDKVKLKARIQSRVYEQHDKNGQIIGTREINELSITDLMVIE